MDGRVSRDVGRRRVALSRGLVEEVVEGWRGVVEKVCVWV